jgi:hypothetical protein
MDYLFVNSQEISALMELPLIQRVTYLMGIRPYMDKQTCIVGIKRKISYQSLREVLYVAPIPGVKTEYPSHQQVRRVIKSLERVGLIAIQSTEKNLILKCLLVEENKSVQNKPGMRPTSEADTNQASDTDVKSIGYKDIHRQADRGKPSQGDTPQKEDIYIYLLSQFEKFWSLYPEKKSKATTWKAFQQLNPDQVLFSKILQALEMQIKNREIKQLNGVWVPPWKYPINWLSQQCWQDEITIDTVQETRHAECKATTRKEHSRDLFCPPSDATNEQQDELSRKNVVQFQRYQKRDKTY